MQFHRIPLLIFMCSISCISALPKEMPSDFSITLQEDGGMRPEGSEIRLSRDISFVSDRKYRKETRTFFRLRNDSLLSLYSTVLENNFDNITSRSEKIYDRGGISIQVTAAQKTYNKSDSGMSIVNKRWREEWNNVQQKVRATANDSLLDQEKSEVTFTFKEIQKPFSLNIRSDIRTLSYQYNMTVDSLRERGTTFYFLKGEYPIQVDIRVDKGRAIENKIVLQIPDHSKNFEVICDPKGCVLE